MYKPEKSKLFGIVLKKLLSDQGLSDRQFARKAELTPDYVSKLVNGKIEEPRLEKRRKIAKGLGLSESELQDFISQYSDFEIDSSASQSSEYLLDENSSHMSFEKANLPQENRAIGIGKENLSQFTQAVYGIMQALNSKTNTNSFQELACPVELNNEIKETQPQKWRCVNIFSGHPKFIDCLTISPDGKTIVSGGADNTIRVWDLASGDLIRSLTEHSACVRTVLFSPDGQTIISGSDDRTIKIWDLSTGELLDTFASRSNVFSMAISPDGLTLAAAPVRVIEIWSLRKRKLIHTLNGNVSDIRSIAFSPNGLTLVSLGNLDDLIEFWEPQTGRWLGDVTGHSKWGGCIVFSPDGLTLISGGGDGKIKVWNFKTRELLYTLHGHLGSIQSLCLSSDGQVLISSSSDMTVKVWNYKTYELLSTLVGHTDWVKSAVFSFDEKAIITASSDRTIRVWQAD